MKRDYLNKPDKPLKRNENLTLLSQEHHHGLVFANRLKQGARKGVDTGVLRDFVLGFWDELAHHFELEEDSLLPLLPENELSEQLKEEHAAIRNQVEMIRKEQQSGSEGFSRLSEMLNNHIRFEERLFFPYAEQQLSAKQLAEVGQVLNGEEVKCYFFQPEFWKT